MAFDVHVFQREGHLHVPEFYAPAAIEELDAALRRAQARAGRNAFAADASLTRVFGLSRYSDDIAAFVHDARLGMLAARLLGVRSVRLMQDVLLEKAAGRLETPWHRDAEYWAFAGAGAVTVWIPLLDIPLSMSPLRFATASHLQPSERSINPLQAMLIPFRFRIASSAFAPGDIVVHHYLTLHGAERNHARCARRALALHFIDGNARFSLPRTDAQYQHGIRCGWTRLRDGEPFPDDIAPIVYHRRNA